MGMAEHNRIYGWYCYGPVDLVGITKGDSTMWLALRDAAGRMAWAEYKGCVYWQLERRQVGTHLSMIQKLTAAELLQHSNSVILRELQKNSDDVEKLILDWEQAGLSFYVHIGKNIGQEFLVVAKSLQYQEKN